MESLCQISGMSRKHLVEYFSFRNPVCLFVTLSVLVLLLVTPDVRASPATPKNIRDIFIGRCEEYQEVIYPKPFIDNPKNCSYLYELFQGAFAFKDPCDVPVEDYSEFVNASDHEIETRDRVMYWSGSVYPLVYEYTDNGRRYVTIRNTLSGYVIRNIDAWCGQTTDPGFNYTDCPPWGQCENQAAPTYWKAISESFAKKVEGHIDVLLNGSSGSAYRNTSTFGQYELANLEPSRNPSLSVLLIHNIDATGAVKETCSNGTLLTLKGVVEGKKMQYKCIDDPPELVHFQCVDYINAAVCGQVSKSSASSAKHLPQNYVIFLQLFLVLALFYMFNESKS